MKAEPLNVKISPRNPKRNGLNDQIIDVRKIFKLKSKLLYVVGSLI